MSQRQMHLVAYLMVPTSHFSGMWKHPLSIGNLLDRRAFESLGRTLEDGLFDMVFVTDTLGIPDVFEGSYAWTVRNGGQGAFHFDGPQILAAMAGATSRLGLGATVSTTYLPPYHLARTLGTLDHMSGGRAAWNIVTSWQPYGAANFGHVPLPPREARYDHADEVLDVVTRLWGSWEEGALLADRERGLFADPERIHRLDHDGEHLKVRGPLSLPRSPQGRPVLMQAGASSRGLEFAARWGEVIFVIKRTVDEMREIRAELRARAEAIGRDPDELKVLPAVQPIVGETTAIAEQRRDFLGDLLTPEVTLALLSAQTGIDFSHVDPDAPFQANGSKAPAVPILQAAADAEGLTVAEVARRFATSELTPQLVGTPAEVADELAELFDAGACDGFVVTPAVFPGSYEDFVRGVVPELQRRGLFRTEYPGTVLRDVLGLPRLSDSLDPVR